jgi:ketosteroid isomerase-like protein
VRFVGTRATLLGAMSVLVSTPVSADAASAAGQIPARHAEAHDLSSPQRAMAAFFVALNSFDAKSYDAMLTDDATLFFTGPPFPIRRVRGRAEIMKLVAPLLDGLRAKGIKGTVAPEGMEFQTWDDTSVVTFDIPAGPVLDRRTFVLRRQHGQWKIAHLHASVTRAGPAAAPTSG